MESIISSSIKDGFHFYYTFALELNFPSAPIRFLLSPNCWGIWQNHHFNVL